MISRAISHTSHGVIILNLCYAFFLIIIFSLLIKYCNSISAVLADSGGRSLGGDNWLSVSHGITEETSDLVSGFATVGDGLSESVDYLNEFWDSDEYDDDNDVGYTRQPIEDEVWFLAHEVDYPSDNEKGGAANGSAQDTQRSQANDDVDDPYLPGYHYFQGQKDAELATPSDYNGLMDLEEPNLMRFDPAWPGFVTQANELTSLENRNALGHRGQTRTDYTEDDQHGSVRSIGVGINSDAADFGSEVRDSLIGGSSEGDLEYFRDQDVGVSRSNRYQKRNEGFSLWPPREEQLDSKSIWPNNSNVVKTENKALNDLVRTNNDMLEKWKKNKKNCNDSSTNKNSRGEDDRSAKSSRSSFSGYVERDATKKEGDKRVDTRLEDPASLLDDQEAVAVQEQVRQIKAQEDEFETFTLKVVHRKNRYCPAKSEVDLLLYFKKYIRY